MYTGNQIAFLINQKSYFQNHSRQDTLKICYKLVLHKRAIVIHSKPKKVILLFSPWYSNILSYVIFSKKIIQ